MPGTFIFKPIEANLTHNTDLLSKMNPYCSFVIGSNRFKGQVCRKGAKHPHWNDTITIPATNEPTALLEVMDQDKITADDEIGHCMIDLSEVQTRGAVSRWYPLSYKNKPAGEILMEAVYQPDASLINQGSTFQGVGAGTGILEGQAGFVETGVMGTTSALQQETIAASTTEASFQSGHSARVFQEQRQFVEPQVFHKQVDVVETRSVVKEVEVTEPVRVLKEVQYTEAVPVIQQIEVTEPQVVTKQVQVMEPRVVTKTIEVIENVPVMKQVDVIEPVTTIKEVETFEPQTFTKTVEVIEQVPVRKQVTVSEPVTVRRDVEYVQPIITTQTITKEIPETIIVDEKVTKEIGPATVVSTQDTGIITQVANLQVNGSHADYLGTRTIGTTGVAHLTTCTTGLHEYTTATTGVTTATTGVTTGTTNIATGVNTGATGFAATGVTGLEERRLIEQNRLIGQERVATGNNLEGEDFARESLLQGALGNQEPGYTISSQNTWQQTTLPGGQQLPAGQTVIPGTQPGVTGTEGGLSTAPTTSYHPSKKF